MTDLCDAGGLAFEPEVETETVGDNGGEHGWKDRGDPTTVDQTEAADDRMNARKGIALNIW